MKTYHAKPGEVTREWLVVDATGIALGRLSSEVAKLLRGKHKPQFTPHVDTGDFVVIVNADKVKITGNKAANEVKARHSGYQGGRKEVTLGHLLENDPERLDRGRGEGHAASQHPRQGPGQEAQGLPRAGSQAPGAEPAHDHPGGLGIHGC